jgi:hypothetical protein
LFFVLATVPHMTEEELPQVEMVTPVPAPTLESTHAHDWGARALNGARKVLGTMRPRPITMARSWALMGIELAVIIVWTLLITIHYLDLDPMVVPTGGEYLSAIQSHNLWLRATECGWCALWNGNMRGGAPAFVDVYGGMLHPLVILATLGWGVLNGTKLALVGAFLMGGLAQWWLAYTLGLGRVARVWSATMAVAAGHLSGRMEIGVFSIVLSTAACSLVLPPLLILNRTRSRRAAVLLGVTLGLAAVAGQGYMQIGLLFALVGALVLVPHDREGRRGLAKRYALAAGLAFLLAAPFLLPFLHFLPQFGKDIDKDFTSVQPFAYVPLNLVIDNFEFYHSEMLQKLPYPYLYVNFIGWVPVLLAIWGLGALRHGEERRVRAFLAIFAFLVLCFSSATPLIWLTRAIPAQGFVEQLAGIHYPSVIAGLAVPAILALAARGLERLLRRDWPQFRLSMITAESASPSLALGVRWLLAVPLILALFTAWSFSTYWTQTVPISPDTYAVLNALRTPDLQWVDAPFGASLFVTPGVGMNLKLASGVRPWHWRDHPEPRPVLEASLGDPPPDTTKQAEVAKVGIYQALGREYAIAKLAGGGITACSAHGSGGMINVTCQTAEPGRLVVEENSWSGWQAWIDGQAVSLERDQWLAVALPAGNHTIEFRYLPWDVPLGLAFCLLGIALTVYLWLKPEPTI